MKTEIHDMTNGGKFYDAVIKKCFHCGNVSFFKITKEQYDGWVENRKFIQELFPGLSKEFREQMISGTHPECWCEMFGDGHE